MASSSSPPEALQSKREDELKLDKDLESMIEEMENIAVQLTLLAYDMVALRINPDLAVAMQKLNDAHQKCKATVCGEQQPEMN